MLGVKGLIRGKQTVVLTESVSGTSSTKYVYTYTCPTDGTLQITVGNGANNWSSDVIYFAGSSLITVGSASGTAADTYSVAATAGTKYCIRVWTTSGAATPLTVVFLSGSATEPSEPETEPTVPDTKPSEPETEPTRIGMWVISSLHLLKKLTLHKIVP